MLVSSHGDLIYAPKGPSTGHILAVLDCETSLSVPLWRITCYPLWFDVLSSAPQARRDPAEARAFRDRVRARAALTVRRRREREREREWERDAVARGAERAVRGAEAVYGDCGAWGEDAEVMEC
ncbi:APH domain-containing protein [Mycena kentingensis (nom. inval.)]|nr:APH domain-containing protein [Mycena kentingensis (nom. inval.)]